MRYVPLFLLFVLCQPALAQQKMQKVIYPGGKVVYEPVPEATAPVTTYAAHAPAVDVAAAPSSTSCCCSGGSGPCTPACKKGLNLPEVKGECGNPKTDCKPITPEIDHNITTRDEHIPFYKKCIDIKGYVPIPVLLKKTVEKCEFKKITYKIDCCEITVCVPCQKCVTISKDCVQELSKEKYDIRVCYRYTDPTIIDVYVLNAPGLPKEWLLFHETKVTVAQQEMPDLQIQAD
ncbi:hypothetical protein [Planctomicrobium piriforme]|uniref:Uncharacterized protein n=1 Tax=Planctomicrobium piriforme TaxID=1576369 RepID=A0A1I3G489_9PLAN|nr:hypothetical protein [Planctomicrobium piriforme]SFI18303.1 hypothetical protein SAMN05421753_106175 [Planctomicrobium piriforme]